METKENEYLRLISGTEVLTLDPTNGNEMISKATDVFDGWIDTNFVGLYGCDVEGGATNMANVQVFDLSWNGGFIEIYGSQKRDLYSMCLTQDQIIVFAKKYRGWLKKDKYGTFFLFEVNTEFFVACVYFASNKFGVRVCRISRDRVWNMYNGHRFVLPER